MRSLTSTSGTCLLAGWLLISGSGCASSVRRVPTAGITAPPRASAAAEATPPPPPDSVPAPPPTPARPAIPWVNPARCLTACAAEPGSELVRLNRQGELDARGPFRLAAPTQVELVALLQAARAAGHALRVESTYRSYKEQARLFADIKEPGRAARPGHSEHQLGTVVDLRLPTSAAIEWLAAHAHDFGFALSYPPGKQKLTGYRPEPWHVRFVGRELAEELFTKKIILEEYFRAQPNAGESGSCADCPQPASQAACGEATPEGSCSGTVLTWCYDGTLAAVDCAVSDQQCGPIAGGAEYDCLPRPSSAAHAGHQDPAAPMAPSPPAAPGG